MPLSLQEKSQIMRHLNVPRDRQPEMEELCDSMVSEISVETVRGILLELISCNESLQEAADGLIQADVLRWSEERNCTLRWRYKALRHDLATFLGYSLPYLFPF